LNTNISIYKQQKIQLQTPEFPNKIIQDISNLYSKHNIKLETIPKINTIEQNSLVLISIPNAIGKQKGGKRYALVVSNTHFNSSGLVTVITSTNPKTKTNNKSSLNTVILIPSNSVEGFSSETLLQCECVTTINREQIVKVYGKLSHELLLKVKSGIENHIPILKF
jgi:mRNA-degrading endonuclease toxin of MazEF toxin-antitoxin module